MQTSSLKMRSLIHLLRLVTVLCFDYSRGGGGQYGKSLFRSVTHLIWTFNTVNTHIRNGSLGHIAIHIHSQDSPHHCRWVQCHMRSSHLKTCPWSKECRILYRLIYNKLIHYNSNYSSMYGHFFQVKLVCKYEILIIITTFIYYKNVYFLFMSSSYVCFLCLIIDWL